MDHVERTNAHIKKMADKKESRKKDRYGKHVSRMKRDTGGGINEITGDSLWVGGEDGEYRDNYEATFGHK